MKATAVIVAAGEGLRIGGGVPKPYLALGGRAMVLRTLDRFFAARSIEKVVLVVAASALARCQRMLREDSRLGQRPCLLQSGGATRQQSVKAGLERIDIDSDIVVIHDGARPFVSPALIDRCVESARQTGAVAVGLPAGDTIKIVAENRQVLSTPDRKALWAIQTPQAFRREWIMEAHDRAVREGIEATDDAMLVERMGKPVWVIDGEKMNLKITLPEDLWLAEAMIREGRIR
jgi:2-C-methyl-D-erythritol 4-phosphate cytidylyltransferase